MSNEASNAKQMTFVSLQITIEFLFLYLIVAARGAGSLIGLGCWLIGDQPAADAAPIKGAVQSEFGRVSRAAVLRSAGK